MLSLRPPDNFPLRLGIQEYRTDMPQKWHPGRVESSDFGFNNIRPEAPIIANKPKSRNARRLLYEATKKSSNIRRIRKNNIFYKYGKWESCIKPLKMMENIIRLNQVFK